MTFNIFKSLLYSNFFPTISKFLSFDIAFPSIAKILFFSIISIFETSNSNCSENVGIT